MMACEIQILNVGLFIYLIFFLLKIMTLSHCCTFAMNLFKFITYVFYQCVLFQCKLLYHWAIFVLFE